MASLFDLFVSISGDNSSYKKAVKDSQSVTDDFGKTIEGLAGKFATAFSVGAIAKFAYDAGKAYESATNSIARATGQTGKALDGLGESFKHLYQNSGRSAEEVASGLAKVATETKLTGRALEELTAANMRFAKVTNSDVGSAVEQTQVLFQNWGIETRDQSAALDVLYKTMTTAGMGASDLSSQMTELGPVARAFGLSFVQTAALVGAFDDAGLRAGDMVKGLSTLFGKFRQAGEDPVKAFEALIEKLRDSHTRGAALAELIDSGLRPALAIKLADAASRGGLAIDDYVKKLQGAPGSVKEVADKTTSLSDELIKLRHAIENSASERGGFLDWMKGVVHQMNEVASKGGIAALFGGGWAAGKAMADAADWTISQGTFGGPKPGAGLNKPGDGAGGPLATIAEVTDRFPKAFRDTGVENALLVMQFDKEVASTKKLLEQIYELRAVIAKRPQGPGIEGQLLGVAPEVFTTDMEAARKIVDDLVSSSLKLPPELQRIADAAQRTTDAFHYFGQSTPRELEAVAAEAKKQYDIMRESGTAAPAAIGKAWAEMFKDQLAAQLATKKITRQEYDDLVRQTDAAFGHISTVAKKTLGQELTQMAGRMFDSLERGIAHSIVQWKGWGDTFKSIAQQTAEDVLQIMLKVLLKPLENAIGKMLGGIGGGAGSAAGSAGGAASGAGGAASAGISGVAGIVTGAVTAVSSVVGNFQMAGMNKSLDVLVNHTLRIFNELANFRQDAWAREQHLMLKLDDMWNEIRNVVSATKSGGGGKGGITVNFYAPVNGNPDAIAQSIFNQLALAGG